jgi:lysyl-tRNA synthetase class 2
MLEFYQAYADYNDMMRLCEELFSWLGKNIFGSNSFSYQGKKIDLDTPFKRISLVEQIKKKSGVDVLSFKNDADAEAAAKKAGIEVEKPRTRARVLDALFTKYVLPELWNPCFVLDYPEYVCPFAKKKRGGEGIAERFELFIAGIECGNAFSEINNPLEQRKKFLAQAEAKRHGDEEAQPLDEDFLEAMEYGMPPTGGVGIGIDRLVMLFTDKASIKEVILFPSMKSLDKKG